MSMLNAKLKVTCWDKLGNGGLKGSVDILILGATGGRLRGHVTINGSGQRF